MAVKVPSSKHSSQLPSVIAPSLADKPGKPQFCPQTVQLIAEKGILAERLGITFFVKALTIKELNENLARWNRMCLLILYMNKRFSSDGTYENELIMSNKLQRTTRPNFDRSRVFAEVQASNRRFDGYSKERRQVYGDRARTLAGLKNPHEKVRCS